MNSGTRQKATRSCYGVALCTSDQPPGRPLPLPRESLQDVCSGVGEYRLGRGGPGAGILSTGTASLWRETMAIVGWFLERGRWYRYPALTLNSNGGGPGSRGAGLVGYRGFSLPCWRPTLTWGWGDREEAGVASNTYSVRTYPTKDQHPVNLWESQSSVKPAAAKQTGRRWVAKKGTCMHVCTSPTSNPTTCATLESVVTGADPGSCPSSKAQPLSSEGPSRLTSSSSPLSLSWKVGPQHHHDAAGRGRWDRIRARSDSSTANAKLAVPARQRGVEKST